jgi:septation ring formation regulator EzrA
VFEEVGDGFGNGKTREDFDVEELALRIDLKEDMLAIAPQFQVDRPELKVQSIHETMNRLFDVFRQDIRLARSVEIETRINRRGSFRGIDARHDS